MGRDGKRAKGRDAKGRGGGRGHGGGKMYIDNIEELQMREGGRRKKDEEEDDDEEEEEEGGETTKEAPAEGQESVFAFERKAKATPAGDDEEDEDEEGGPIRNNNPNHNPAPVDPNNPEAGLSRKQREALAAQRAKEDYQRRHMAGETEKAREELARLALVRARREAAAKKREAEGRAPGMSAFGVDSDGSGDEKPAAKPAPAPEPAPDSVAAKKRAAAAAPAEDEAEKADGPAKLKAMDIKKMNGDALKEHCKERGLSIQGQKKELMQRLLDYEAARK